MSRADRLAAIESGAFAPWAAAPIVANTKTLSDAEAAGCQADATAGSITLTLPAANTPRDVYIRRIDVTQNAIVILAAGTDKLMLDTTAAVAGQTQTELLFAGDWMQLRSDGAGKWWCVGQAQLPGSIASGLVSYATAGAHTFTVPAVLRSGRRRARIIVTGGGGGASGGQTSPTVLRGATGSAGGTAKGVVDLAGITSVPITVGAGGVGGASEKATGAPGGTSSFGAYLSATGGSGAAYAGSGAGGTGIGGGINLTGGYGADFSPDGGVGGASVWGGGGKSTATSGAGGIAPGSGGGSGQSAGAKGAGGIVVIEW